MKNLEENLKEDLKFLKIIDKTKTILRMNKLIDVDQREDIAQHSFHIALMAMVLEDYSDYKIDINKVVKMLLIHDLVEIYSGDTFAYDEEAKKGQRERELKAAEKVFSINEKGKYFRELWDEFEECKSPEAIFANGIDRVQPILQNYYNNGGIWVDENITIEQVMDRIDIVKKSSKKLYELLLNIIDEGKRKGWLKD